MALITTVNSNTLVTLTSSSFITTTVLSPVSGMVSIDPALAISVGQNLNFQTRLDAINAIFKLGSTLEKFTSKNSPSGKS